MNEVITNIDLKKLAAIENFSGRTYNVCEYNDLDSLVKILQYYSENGTFKKLKNCGSKTEQELVDIYNKYNYKINTTSEIQAPKNDLVETIEKLTIKQKAVLNNIISTKFNKLSQRSSNALSDYLDNLVTVKNLKEYIFSNDHFDTIRLRNIGSKASKEINLFLEEIKELINIVSVFDDEKDLTRELFNTLLIKLFSIDHNLIKTIGQDYDFSDGIPIFKTIKILIENDYIFKPNERVIFNHSLGFFRNRSPLTLEETGSKIGITRERTRQIRNYLLESFNRRFSFVEFFEKESLNLYNLDTTSLILNTDQTFIDELSKNEMVYYNSFFINRIFSILLKDKYSLIGNETKVVLGKSSSKHYNWTSTYLVLNQFQSIFDFEKLISDVGKRLSTKKEEGYKFHFQTYLLNFQKSDCFFYLDEISQIAEQILFNELEIIIDSEESINFPKNGMKTIPEYIYNILNKAGEPMTAFEIFDILNQQHPGISKNAEALRANCQRDSRLIYFGRSSTYGLKVWEKKLENIKGGTMHDISEEFLLKFNEPKHIDEIVEYVISFRKNVTSKNLYYNLKSAEHRKFIFFKNAFIGLVSKSYDTGLFSTVPKDNIDRRSWEELYKLLILFTTKNSRLPSSSGTKEEKRLYSFFYLQVKKFSELDEKKKKLIEILKLKYNYHIRTKYNSMMWDKLYDELVFFLHKNKRMPSARRPNEKKLYRFYSKQKKLYKEEELSKEYLSKFLSVAEIKNLLHNEH